MTLLDRPTAKTDVQNTGILLVLTDFVVMNKKREQASREIRETREKAQNFRVFRLYRVLLALF
jgi:hypothetical protein